MSEGAQNENWHWSSQNRISDEDIATADPDVIEPYAIISETKKKKWCSNRQDAFTQSIYLLEGTKFDATFKLPNVRAFKCLSQLLPYECVRKGGDHSKFMNLLEQKSRSVFGSKKNLPLFEHMKWILESLRQPCYFLPGLGPRAPERLSTGKLYGLFLESGPDKSKFVKMFGRTGGSANSIEYLDILFKAIYQDMVILRNISCVLFPKHASTICEE